MIITITAVCAVCGYRQSGSKGFAMDAEGRLIGLTNDEIITFVALFMAIALTIAFAVLFYDYV